MLCLGTISLTCFCRWGSFWSTNVMKGTQKMPWAWIIYRQLVVVACAVSEHRSRAPAESCRVMYCTPQALSLFLESCGSCVTLHKLCHCFLSHETLCCVRGLLQNHFHCSVSLPLCLCPFLFVYCPPDILQWIGNFPPSLIPSTAG